MSLKRKAAHVSVASIDTPDTKRHKGQDDGFVATRETPQRTTEIGLEFLTKLKAARDKRERLIATDFLTLPDPKHLPNYYQHIKLPIAIDTVEEKLRNHAYPNMSAVESDLKRMVANAKSYNERTSEIHSDAEKIRKMVSNQFKDLNPAYGDPNYQATPTPVPGEDGVKQESPQVQAPTPESVHATAPEPPGRQRRSVILHGPKGPGEHKSQAPATPAPIPAPAQATSSSGPRFQSKTFQQAQEMIIQELIDLKNESGELISGNFLNLPSRSLKDYYDTIKSPRSLKKLQKQVSGKKGHGDATGVSEFRTWQDFENNVSLVWHNAREYNVEGSEIVTLANELESYFNKRVAEAKLAVPDPAPKVKLKLSANVKSPEPAPALKLTLTAPKPGPGVSIDTDALRRQQDLVRAGANSTHADAARATPNALDARPVSSADASNQIQGQSPFPANAANGIKTEVQTPGLPPATSDLSNGTPHTLAGGIVATGVMPPPATTSRPLSGSPYPHSHIPQQQVSTNAFETQFRMHGKTAADALFTNLDVITHPSLHPRVPENMRFKLHVPPSDNLTQQSFTFYLPNPNTHLRLILTMQAQMAVMRTMKTVATINGQLVQQRPEDADARRHTFDLALQAGMLSRIEIHMIAGPARGAPKVGNAQEIDFEKVTLFVYRELGDANS